MSEATERRQALRQNAEGTGMISFGQEPVACRVIDVSERGAQVRIDGRRASRNLVGKRTTIEGVRPEPLTGRVVWARPAVNGVYLGIAIDAVVEAKAASPAAE
jgi:hypothetical protein